MIILYHSIVPEDAPPDSWRSGQALPRAAFIRQVTWLADHYHIVPMADYLACKGRPGFTNRKLVALTFDDGFQTTFECIFPYLVKRNIPATIFVTTGHLENGELLWFSYIKALCFESRHQVLEVDQRTFPLQAVDQRQQAWQGLRFLARQSGDPAGFQRMLSAVYPLEPALAARYAGMTHEQLKAACNTKFLELGAHTITHPFLDQLSKAEQEQEIFGSKRILSEIIGRPVRNFAYPAGEYNDVSVELAKTAGYEAAFAIIPRKMGIDPRYEMERVGIYSQSLLKLRLKALGLAGLARRFGFRVG